jgi:hypothetical protein
MQPVPRVTEADVERVVRRDFPSGDHGGVLDVLHQYGTEPWQREESRVRLAALKLADGDAEQLRRHIEVAKRDYRDVLAAAEYPGYMRDIPPAEDVPAEEKQRVIDRDRAQYEAWLRRE